MISRETDIGYNLGTIVFLCAFLFFAFAFTEKSNCSTHSQTSYSLEYVMGADYFTDHLDVAITNISQLISLQKIFEGVSENSYLKIILENLVIENDNRKADQAIITFQKVRFSIDPKLIWTFHYHLISIYAEDLPVLG